MEDSQKQRLPVFLDQEFRYLSHKMGLKNGEKGWKHQQKLARLEYQALLDRFLEICSLAFFDYLNKQDDKIVQLMLKTQQADAQGLTVGQQY